MSLDDHTVRVERSGDGPRLAFAERFNVAVPFIDRHLAEGRGARPAIVSDAATVTYAELAERVARTGRALLDRGLTPGDRVLLVLLDRPEFFYAFWGAIKAGLVPVPVNTLLRAADYAYLLEDSRAAALLYSQELATEVEAGLKAAAHRPALVASVGGPPPTLEELLAEATDALEPAPATATADCFWLYSSGTTGRPKAAVHAHRDMVVTGCFYAEETLGLGPDDRCFSAAKLFFAYGLGNAMSFPLWRGATAVLAAERPTPERTFEVIERHRPTLFFGVPTLYAAQLKTLATARPDLSSLRLCVSAGEALPADIWRRWKERTGLTILDGIGSTEALHIFLSNRPDDVRPGTSGRPVPGYAVRLLDADGHEVTDDAEGQLWVRGASLAGRYENQPAKSAATFVDGWMATGDTYRRDADGYYAYCGRSDDMLKIGGIWCSPFEIEARLIEHPRVLEAAVVGRADDEGLLKPEAWIVLDDGTDPGAGLDDELRDHCKRALAPYKYPRWFRFVDTLPKTATGKIQRFRLRAGGWPAAATG